MRDKTNINVHVVDFRPMFDKLKDKYIKENPNFKDKEFSLYIPETWGFVETKKGKLMISDEGIVDQNPISEINPFYTAIYVQETKPYQHFSVFPIGEVVVKKLEEIEELPIVIKQPLEKFIREFGERLESNFRICSQFLQPIVRP